VGASNRYRRLHPPAKKRAATEANRAALEIAFWARIAATKRLNALCIGLGRHVKTKAQHGGYLTSARELAAFVPALKKYKRRRTLTRWEKRRDYTQRKHD